MREHIDYLFDYLGVLAQVQASGHYVNEEIKETVKAIRIELGFEEIKKEVKDSKKLLFDSLIEPNFTTDNIFHAVIERKEKELVVPYERMSGATTSSIELVRLFPHVHFVTNHNIAMAQRHERIHGFDKTLSLKGIVKGVVIVDDNVSFKGNDLNCRIVRLKGVELF